VRQARSIRQPAALEVLGTADRDRRDDPAAEGLRPRDERVVSGQLRAGTLLDLAARRLRREARGQGRRLRTREVARETAKRIHRGMAGGPFPEDALRDVSAS